MKIALIPVSAKPYTAGHDKLVESAYEAGYHPIVIPSYSGRGGDAEQAEITRDQMKELWGGVLQDYLFSAYGATILAPEDSGYPSPVAVIYEFLTAVTGGHAPEFMADLDPEEIEEITIWGGTDRGSLYNNIASKFTHGLMPVRPQIVQRDEGTGHAIDVRDSCISTIPVAQVSGTLVRKIIKCKNLGAFVAAMPANMSRPTKLKIFSILEENKAISDEKLLRALIRGFI